MTDPPANEEPRPETPRLALTQAEASVALGIGRRLLWARTNDGTIPHVRLGGRILYGVDSLRDWLKRQSQGGDNG